MKNLLTFGEFINESNRINYWNDKDIDGKIDLVSSYVKKVNIPKIGPVNSISSLNKHSRLVYNASEAIVNYYEKNIPFEKSGFVVEDFDMFNNFHKVKVRQVLRNTMTEIKTNKTFLLFIEVRPRVWNTDIDQRNIFFHIGFNESDFSHLAKNL